MARLKGLRKERHFIVDFELAVLPLSLSPYAHRTALSLAPCYC